MILFLLKILGAIRDVVVSVVTGVINLVTKYPVQSLCLAILIASNLGTAWYVRGVTTANVTAKYKKVIDDLNIQVANFKALEESRKKHIAEVEASSKAAADKAEASLKAKDAELAASAKSWSAKLAAEIEKRKNSKEIIYVTNPVTQDKVEVTLDKGEVVCGRLRDAFVDGINEMVDVINKDLAKPITVPTPSPSPSTSPSTTPKPTSMFLDSPFIFAYDLDERAYIPRMIQ